MKIPSRERCFELLKQWHVPDHVIKHILKVNKVAVYLANKFKEKGNDVDVELIDRASLLHDLLRVCNFKAIEDDKFGQSITDEDRRIWEKTINDYGHMHHGDAAYEVLKHEYPEVANLVRKHRYRLILDEKNRPRTLNEKIIYYSDKRVKHDQIVSIQERAEDGHKRNPHLHESYETEEADRLVAELEKEIFSMLDIEPDDLLKLNENEHTN
ncbi:HD domain-containing protein [Candidatus Woesearchaeota archaeon]|nr:HD domain-containing protein [Candidatus Woesearchaeota archaeon]MBW3021979.1 HD domain-containing protein [Candidatus Woesearchaeota archaeon]